MHAGGHWHQLYWCRTGRSSAYTDAEVFKSEIDVPKTKIHSAAYYRLTSDRLTGCWKEAQRLCDSVGRCRARFLNEISVQPVDVDAFKYLNLEHCQQNLITMVKSTQIARLDG